MTTTDNKISHMERIDLPIFRIYSIDRCGNNSNLNTGGPRLVRFQLVPSLTFFNFFSISFQDSNIFSYYITK